VPVEMREWIGPALASPDLVLDAQPPAQPHSGVIVDRPIRCVAVACMVELLAAAEATVFRRIIEYPIQGRFGARSAYSLW